MKRERSESLRRLLARMQGLALLCVLVLWVPEALGATNGQPAVAGVSRVRVTLALWPGENAHAIAAQIGATYRVGVESVMAEGEGVTVVASASDAAVAMLSRDPRVTSIEAAVAQPSATVRPLSVVVPSAKPLTPQSDATSLLTLGPYEYDGSGNVWKVGAEAYEYDVLGRVARGTAATGHQQAYEYDTFGNLEKITTTVPGQSPVVRDLAVDSDTNRLEAPSGNEGVGASYDAVGRVIASPRGDAFTYDALDMVTSSSNGIAKHVHLYRPNDERIASVVFLGNAKQGTNWTIRDTGGAILRRYHESSAGAWTWQKDYIYADGKLLASEGATTQQRRHYFADHLGTPRLITDGFGREVSRHNYYPFGEEIRASVAVDASTERLRFTGHERDYMTGATGPEDRLDYMHARYYENGWGRFLSVDPAASAHAQVPQSWNRYSYVRNNPLKLVDPDGQVAVGFTGLTGRMRSSHIHKINRALTGTPGLGQTKVLQSNQAAAGAAYVAAAYKKNPNQPVVLYGHSWGGGAALRVAERLARMNIPVDLLVTFDPVGRGMDFGRGSLEVPPNVALALNYYQTALFQLGNNQLKAMSEFSQVFNVELQGVDHTEVDDVMGAAMTNVIQSIAIHGLLEQMGAMAAFWSTHVTGGLKR